MKPEKGKVFTNKSHKHFESVFHTKCSEYVTKEYWFISILKILKLSLMEISVLLQAEEVIGD